MYQTHNAKTNYMCFPFVTHAFLQLLKGALNCDNLKYSFLVTLSGSFLKDLSKTLINNLRKQYFILLSECDDSTQEYK
ncbi:hypothetical protein T4D_15018 [Trichinella pseudospiralis]|uniref:Uncharacterized protein n=1 Tax=Trichinella pseudospiralis TaxID=6337 RepID=A0A0V1FU96_TRIPS|nr:hypothetical protein T4D_15018 [Trichinella pseudospiralis]